MGKGSGTTSTNSTQRSEPWSPLQPYLTGRAAVAPSAGTPGHYMYGSTPYGVGANDRVSQTWIPGTPATQGQSAITGLIPGIQNWYDQNQAPSANTASGYEAARQRALQGSQFDPAANQTYGDTLSGRYLDPATNPYLQSTYDQAARNVGNSVNSQFAASGRYGSGAHAGVLAQGLGNLATNIYGGNYEQERARQMQALGMLPQFNSRDYQNLSALTGANQALSDYPYQQLSRYGGLLQGAGGGYGTTTGTQQTPYFDNSLAQIAGLGLTGAALYASGGLSGLGAGAGAGGMMGLRGTTAGLFGY